jgi:hypothetical protein
MGFYVAGPARGKAQFIVENIQGKILKECPKTYADIPEGQALIVIVDNGSFEAAGFCYSEAEFKVFTDPFESRRRQYILINRGLVEEITGYKKAVTSKGGTK